MLAGRRRGEEGEELSDPKVAVGWSVCWWVGGVYEKTSSLPDLSRSLPTCGFQQTNSKVDGHASPNWAKCALLSPFRGNCYLCMSLCVCVCVDESMNGVE